MKRILAVHLGAFRLERLIRERPALAEVPLGIYERQGSRQALVACNALALAQGVRCGSTVTAARARCPQLRAAAVEPEAERADLERAAEALAHLSPQSALDPPQVVLIDITSSSPLFGGEDACAEAARLALEALEYTASVAVADGIASATALAERAQDPLVVCPPGQARTMLADLPLSALRPTPATEEKLAWAGIRTVSQLSALPRSSLVRRFGDEGERLYGWSRGIDERVFEPYRPERPLTERMEFEERYAQIQPLLFRLKSLLDRLEARMHGRAVAALRLELELTLDRSSDRASKSQIVEIVLSRPSRNASTLLSLYRERLGAVKLDAPVTALEMRVVETSAHRGVQLDLLERAEATSENLDELLARLISAFGIDAVFAPALAPRHRPEAAYARQRYDPPRQAAAEPACAGQRPTVLLPAPEPLDWEGERVRVLLRGRLVRGRAVGVAPPERLRGEWWSDFYCRDYHVLTLEDGARWWIFRDRTTDQWFLHGLFE